MSCSHNLCEAHASCIDVRTSNCDSPAIFCHHVRVHHNIEHISIVIHCDREVIGFLSL